MLKIVEVTKAARLRDPKIGTTVESGLFRIVRVNAKSNGVGDVEVLAGPMAGYLAVEALERFANGGNLIASVSV